MMSEDQILDELATAERAAYDEKLWAENRHRKAKIALCQEIASRGVSSVIWGDQKITRVESERVIVDEELLRKMINPDLWEKIIKEKVDTTKVRELVLTGEIDVSVFEKKAITIANSSAYARFGKLEDEVEDIN